jgi:hypothetical protein
MTYSEIASNDSELMHPNGASAVSLGPAILSNVTRKIPRIPAEAIFSTTRSWELNDENPSETAMK